MYKLLLISMLIFISACGVQGDSTKKDNDKFSEDMMPAFDKAGSEPIGGDLVLNRIWDKPEVAPCIEKLYNPNLKGSYTDWWSEVKSNEFCGTLEAPIFEAAFLANEDFTSGLDYKIEYGNKDIYLIWSGAYIKPSESKSITDAPVFNVYENSETDLWLVKNNVTHEHVEIIDGQIAFGRKAHH